MPTAFEMYAALMQTHAHARGTADAEYARRRTEARAKYDEARQALQAPKNAFGFVTTAQANARKEAKKAHEEALKDLMAEYADIRSSVFSDWHTRGVPSDVRAAALLAAVQEQFPGLQVKGCASSAEVVQTAGGVEFEYRNGLFIVRSPRLWAASEVSWRDALRAEVRRAREDTLEGARRVFEAKQLLWLTPS